MTEVERVLKMHRHGFRAALARELGIKHSQTIDLWKRTGSVPAKYALRFCRLTGADIKKVCPDMVS